MVVVHRAHGFRFVIYTDDHQPGPRPHRRRGPGKVHLLGPGGRPEVVSVVGIKRSDMRRLYAEVVACRDEFLAEWERIHGRAD